MPSPIDTILIGALLLALVTVESGGWFLTRVSRGLAPANPLQQSFFRAGHAHAGVLIVLSVAILAVLSDSALDGGWLWVARLGVPIAAILMPAGFFLSVLGRDPERPSRAILLLWLGAASLTIGLVTAGVGLLAGGIRAL
ncbi:hypothetical protein [Agromyces kandeliae]|uniref:Uncharacterized protein n=1 Tax=Agromyces kandeliae TaxID=2666141 RepID=A0A6L5R0H2_9MICO|nr:hypothetical protein [Agromyces kandeliae]MRX43459.1 hypothetical protein [Agromyces kandeliae]